MNHDLCPIINSLLHFVRDTMLEPTTVFALLFGSELFEDYIGHLSVASMASSELATETDNPDKLNDKLKVDFFQYFLKPELIFYAFWLTKMI